MTAQEFFGISYKPTNFRVDFYVGSYQYREPKMFTIETASDFEDKKKLVSSMLRSDKNKASQSTTETYWVTFSEEVEVNGELKYSEKMFEERIRV